MLELFLGEEIDIAIGIGIETQELPTFTL